jgi:hypothetical protein
MRLAGALVLDKNEADFPPNPSLGTLVIKDYCMYAYLLIGGMQTWFPFGYKNTNTYVHSQGGESLAWTVTHNLGSTKVWWQVQSPDGQIINPASVDIISANQIRLNFTEAVIGTVLIVAPNAMDVPSIRASLIEVGQNVQITTGGMTINGQPVLTGTTMTVGDGSGATKITYTDKQRLDIAPGVGIEIQYDDVAKKITLNAPGSSVTPAVVAAEIAKVTGTPPAGLNTLEKIAASIGNSTNFAASVSNGLALKLDVSEVASLPTANKVLRLDANGNLPTNITGNAATATNVAFSGVTNTPTTLAGYGITDAASKSGSATQDFQAKTVTATSILPSGPDVDIGSESMRFRSIYVDEAYLSTNTLYLGDTPVMGTSADTIHIRSDVNQAITMSTKGTGVTTVASERGVNLSTSGLNSDVVVQATGAGSKVRMGATSSIDTTAPQLTHTGNASVTGSVSIGTDLTVAGKVTFQGAVFEVNSTTVTTKDNIIVVNNGQVGSGVTAGRAGIQVDRGDEPDYQMVFDEADDMFKVGMVGQLQTIASQNFVTDGFAPKAHVGQGGVAHAVATTVLDGFMSSADKIKLNSIDANVKNYVHPTSDGDHHVPATGTTNGGKVLKAGTTAGSEAWGFVDFSEVTAKPTTIAGYGITDALLASSYTAADVLAKLKTVDGTASGLDADQLDGFHASQAATASNVAVRDASGKLAGDILGNSATASKLATARSVALSGDASGTANFDGSADVSIAVTLPNVVMAGTSAKVSYDAKGRVTGAAALVAADIPNLDWSKITSGKPSTLTGYGITDAVSNAEKNAANGVATLDSSSKLSASQVPSNVIVNDGSVAMTGKLKANAGVTLGASGEISLESKRLTTSAATAATLFTLATASFRGAKVIVSVTDDANNVHMTEFLAIHDGSSVSLTQYGVITSNGELGSFDALIVGGTNLVIQFTPSSATARTVVASMTAMSV